MSDRVEKLEAELAEMRKSLESSSKEMNKFIKEKAQDAREFGEDVADDAQSYMRRGVRKVRNMVDDCPVENHWLITGAAVTGVVVAGVIATLLVRRSDNDWLRYVPDEVLKRFR